MHFIIIAEPIKISIPPKKKYIFGVDRNMIKLNNTIKKGYAISIIEAVEAPKFFILVKLKKFAIATRTAQIKMRTHVDFSIVSTFFIWIALKKINGIIIQANNAECINKRMSGDTFVKIF